MILRLLPASLPVLAMSLSLTCSSEVKNRNPAVEQSGIVADQQHSANKTVKGWRKTSDLPATGASLAIHCANSRSCWLFDSSHLWQSQTGGTSWSLLSPRKESAASVQYHFADEQIGWRYSPDGLPGRRMAAGAGPNNRLHLIQTEVRNVLPGFWILKSAGWQAGSIDLRLMRKEESVYQTMRDLEKKYWKRQYSSPVMEGRPGSVRNYLTASAGFVI